MSEIKKTASEDIYCPYLGVTEGMDTHFGYSSRGNRCWRSGKPARIRSEHQTSHCLNANYQTCTVFNRQGDASEQTRREVLIPSKRLTPALPLVLAVVLVLIAVSFTLLFTGVVRFPGSETVRQWFAGIQQIPTTAAQTPDASSAITLTETPASPQAAGPYPYPIPLGSTAEYPAPSAQIQVGDLNSLTVNETGSSSSRSSSDDVSIDRPDAYEVRIQGGRGLSLEPVYTIPDQDSYNFIVDGQTMSLTSGSNKTFTQSGDEYSVQIIGVLADPEGEERLNISNDGTSLKYFTELENRITIIMEHQYQDQTFRFYIYDIRVSSGQGLSVVADLPRSQLILDNEGFSVGDYHLRILNDSPEDQLIFIASAIDLDSIQSHTFDYSRMVSKDTVIQEIDNRRQGALDEIVNWINQASFSYIPFVTK
jgi:hypothetical protein